MTAAELFRLFILPPAGIFLLLAIGWMVKRRWPRIGRGIGLVAMLVFFILTTPVGADFLVAPLENMTTPLLDPRGSGAQAIVVLAAGRMKNAPEYGDSHIPDYIALARLRYAARLQHQTGLPILVSGGNPADDAGRDSKAASLARALREDFRTPVTWIEDGSETTAENAVQSQVILEANGIKRILLVTDAMHMSRAEPMFAATGLQVVAAPTMFFRLREHDLRLFVPSAEGLRCSWYASYEWIGILWYRLQTLRTTGPI